MLNLQITFRSVDSISFWLVEPWNSLEPAIFCWTMISAPQKLQVKQTSTSKLFTLQLLAQCDVAEDSATFLNCDDGAKPPFV